MFVSFNIIVIFSENFNVACCELGKNLTSDASCEGGKSQKKTHFRYQQSLKVELEHVIVSDVQACLVFSHSM